MEEVIGGVKRVRKRDLEIYYGKFYFSLPHDCAKARRHYQ
jgi:hypothetical protein